MTVAPTDVHREPTPHRRHPAPIAVALIALVALDGVELAGSNIVRLRVGGERSVAVHADDNLLDHVTTIVRHGTLVIDNTGSFSTKSPMSVEVTVPSLHAIALSGSGTVAVEDVRAPRVDVLLSGSGQISASGETTRLDATLDGSGDVQLAGLVARDVHAVLNASGRILVNATNSLDASVHGSGAIIYVGSPVHVTKIVTGSGAIVGG